MLGYYHDCLVRAGVRGYDFDDLLSDYSHYSFAAVCIAIFAAQMVERTERGDALCVKMASDAICQALDNGFDEHAWAAGRLS